MKTTATNSPPVPPRYISAEILRRKFQPAPSLRTISSWTKAKILPSIKIGHFRYYDEVAVVQKIAERLTIHARGTQKPPTG